MKVLHADFTGTATNPFEVMSFPCDVTVSINDQATGADGVYYLQHLDRTTADTPAWVDLHGSADALTATDGGAAALVFPELPTGVYRLNTSSESGTVDIFVGGLTVSTDNIDDPVS